MKANNFNTTVKVTRHIILKNFWEVYIIDEEEMEFPKDSDIQYAYVVGDAHEFGTIDLMEYKPYTISDTTNLNDVAAAPDWEWID